jgi:hypothetical protein
MSQLTDDAGEIIWHYYELFVARYHEHWKPSTDHIGATIDLLRSPMPGIPGYTKEDLLARLDAFFHCKEDWVLSTKHNFSVYVKHVHRWLPAKIPQPTPPLIREDKGGVYRCDCGNELQLGEICLKCFPLCSNCGYQHATSETCEEVAKREERLKRMFNHPDKREGKIKTISGEDAFDSPREIDHK